MTVNEYIIKLHKWTKDFGPEDKVEVTPYRLISIFDPNLGKYFLYGSK